MNTAIRLAALASLLAVTGCAAKRPAARSSASAALGPAEQIAITGSDLLVNGQHLVTIRELEELPLGHGPLVHLAVTLPPRPDKHGEQRVIASDDAPAYWAMNAMWTAAMIGYRAVRVDAGGVSFDGWYELPQDAPPRVHDALVLDDAPDGVHLVWKSDRACDRVPADAVVQRAELAPYLARACGERSPCVDTVELYTNEATSFADTIRMLAAVRAHASAQLPFAAHGPDSDPSSSGRRVCGRPFTSPLAAAIQPAQIQRVATEGLAEMRACYEKGLSRHPDLEGKVVTSFAIGEDGHVVQTAPADGTTIADPAVVACVSDAFRRLTFPPLGEGKSVRVVYPVVFERDEPSQPVML